MSNGEESRALDKLVKNAVEKCLSGESTREIFGYKDILCIFVPNFVDVWNPDMGECKKVVKSITFYNSVGLLRGGYLGYGDTLRVDNGTRFLVNTFRALIEKRQSLCRKELKKIGKVEAHESSDTTNNRNSEESHKCRDKTATG